MFLINQANIRAGELKTDAMLELQKEIREANAAANREIEEINISSYASPDGGYDLNRRLAENREKNTDSYLRGQLKKDKITEFGELTSQFTAEDWEAFPRTCVEKQHTGQRTDSKRPLHVQRPGRTRTRDS